MKKSSPFKGTESAFIYQGGESSFSLPKTAQRRGGTRWAQKATRRCWFSEGQAVVIPLWSADTLGRWLGPPACRRSRLPPTPGASPLSLYSTKPP